MARGLPGLPAGAAGPTARGSGEGTPPSGKRRHRGLWELCAWRCTRPQAARRSVSAISYPQFRPPTPFSHPGELGATCCGGSLAQRPGSYHTRRSASAVKFSSSRSFSPPSRAAVISRSPRGIASMRGRRVFWRVPFWRSRIPTACISRYPQPPFEDCAPCCRLLGNDFCNRLTDITLPQRASPLRRTHCRFRGVQRFKAGLSAAPPVPLYSRHFAWRAGTRSDISDFVRSPAHLVETSFGARGAAPRGDISWRRFLLFCVPLLARPVCTGRTVKAVPPLRAVRRPQRRRPAAARRARCHRAAAAGGGRTAGPACSRGPALGRGLGPNMRRTSAVQLSPPH